MQSSTWCGGRQPPDTVTARREDRHMWPRWCCLCDGLRWHRMAAPPAPVRATTSSYHRRASDASCMERKIVLKHPVDVSSGPGTGSRSRGQLSLLSIGRIGLQIPGGGLSLNGRWGHDIGAVWHGVWCCQTALVVVVLDRGTTASPQHPPRRRLSTATRSGRPEAAQLRRRPLPLGDGGWLLSIHTRTPRQPTTVMPLLISFVQAMQPRTGPAVGEQI